MKSEAQTELLLPLTLAFVLGIVLMGAVYLTEFELIFGQWTAAIVAAIVIISLGVWFLAARRDVVDMEKAGDGCYYLGLVFTLLSLIFVLSGFGGATTEASAEERTNDVISKFGVALISTLVGVVFRVALQSAAKDEQFEPAEFTPDRAQVVYGDALSTATRRTLRELRTAEQGFSRFSRSALQNVETMERRVGSAGQKAGENVVEAFERIAQSAETLGRSVERMQEQALKHDEQIRDQTASLSRHFLSTRDAIAETSQNLNEAKAITSQLAETLSRFNADAETAAKSLRDFGRETAAEFADAHREAGGVLRDAASQALSAAGGLAAAGKEAAAAVSGAHEEASVALGNASSRAELAAKGLGEAGRNAAMEVSNSHQEAAAELWGAASEAGTAAKGLADAGKMAAAEVTGSQGAAAEALRGASANAKKDAAELGAEIQAVVEKLKAQGKVAAVEVAKDAKKASDSFPRRLFRRLRP